MKYLISDFEMLDIDGQKLLLPANEQWSQLFSGAEINNQPVLAVDLTKALYGLARDHKELKLYLRQLREGGVWTLICLYSKDQILNQRVHLERLTCGRCKAFVWSANPLDYELYFNTRDAEGLYQMARKLPRASCPICSADLPRPSIFSFQQHQGVPASPGRSRSGMN